jgi:hypothetical protein
LLLDLFFDASYRLALALPVVLVCLLLGVVVLLVVNEPVVFFLPLFDFLFFLFLLLFLLKNDVGTLTWNELSEKQRDHGWIIKNELRVSFVNPNDDNTTPFTIIIIIRTLLLLCYHNRRFKKKMVRKEEKFSSCPPVHFLFDPSSIKGL